MSLPEVLLWEQLRASKLGMKVRRQHPIGPYIADVYCTSSRLVIEIDGEAHDRADRPQRDDVRDAAMRGAGLSVLRIAAADVLKDMDAVLQIIRAAFASPLHHPADGPPPRAGEEFI